MAPENRVSYYIDKYGVFHRILKNQSIAVDTNLNPTRTQEPPKVCSTWLRLIMMFWNTRVMVTAVRFGVAAVIMNQYERLGFAVLLLCFAL